MPTPRVDHLDAKFDLSAGERTMRRHDTDRPSRGELDGIADQIEQDLADPNRIADEPGRDVLGARDVEAETLAVRLLSKQRGDALQSMVEAEADRFRCQAAGLEL